LDTSKIDRFLPEQEAGSGSTLVELYDQVYDFSGKLGHQHRDMEEALLFAGLVPDSGEKPLEIIEVGCAEGTLSVELARKGHCVTAVDISQGFIDRSREAAAAGGVALKTRRQDIEAEVSSLDENSFDVAYLMDVLEHFRNPLAALTNIRKVLKPHGILFINTPNVVCLRKIMRCLFKRKQLIDFYTFTNLHDYHLQTYDYAQLEKTLNFVGFKVEKVIPNRATLPKLSRVRFLQPAFRLFSRIFPMLSDNLLVKCRKTAPINMKDLIKLKAMRHRGIEIKNL